MFRAPEGGEKPPKNHPLEPMQARWSHETLTEIWPCSPLPSIGKEERTAPFLHRHMVKKKLETLQGLHKLNMFTNFSPGNLSRSSCPRREGLQLRSSGAGYGILPFPMTWLRPSCQAAPSCLQVEGSGKAGGSQPEGERDFCLAVAASFLYEQTTPCNSWRLTTGVGKSGAGE